MLYLDPRIYLDEIVLSMTVQEKFHSTCITVVNGAANFDGIAANSLPLLLSDRKCRGKLHDLLVTPLYHFGFPLVNYALGDQVQLETLSGGVKGLRRIKGRENDKIFNRDGSYYIYSTIYQLMSNIEGVKQFRIVQKTYDDLLVYIVKTRQPVCSDETIKRVVSERAEKQFDMGAKNLSFEFVDELQPDSSGKMRMMISEIYGQK